MAVSIPQFTTHIMDRELQKLRDMRNADPTSRAEIVCAFRSSAQQTVRFFNDLVFTILDSRFFDNRPIDSIVIARVPSTILIPGIPLEEEGVEKLPLRLALNALGLEVPEYHLDVARTLECIREIVYTYAAHAYIIGCGLPKEGVHEWYKNILYLFEINAMIQQSVLNS